MPLGEFFVSGDWNSPDLTLDSLSLKSSDIRVSSHAQMSFIEPSPIVLAKCELEVPLLSFVDALEALGIYSLPRIDVMLGIDLSITGALAEPAIDVNVEADGLNWDQISTGELSVHAVGKKSSSFWTLETNAECKLFATPDKVIKAVNLSTLVTISDSLTSVKDFALSLPDLTVHGKLEFRSAGDDTRIDGSLKVKGSISDAADIVAYFTSPAVGGIDGTVDISGDINGSIHNPDFRIVGTIPILQHRNLSITNINLDSKYDQGKITLTRFDGDLSKGRLSIEGDLATATLQHHLELNASNIDLFYLWSSIFEVESPFEGFVNGNIVSSGKLSDPSTYLIKSRLALDTVEFAGVAIPPFNAVLSSDRGEINLIFTQSDARIQAQGHMQRDSLTGNFAVHLLEMEPYAALLNLNDLSGELNINGSISGRYSDPTIEVAMTGNRWLYKDFPIDSLSGRLSVAGGELSFADAVIYGELASIDPKHPPFGLSGLSGVINYTGNLQGALANPVISLTVNVSNLLFRKVNLQSVRCTAQT